MLKVTTAGIALAKSVFPDHGIDARGEAVQRKPLKRAELPELFAKLPSYLIGMQACAGACHWASKLIELGHQGGTGARGLFREDFEEELTLARRRR